LSFVATLLQQLQADAVDPQVPLSHLLRKALILSKRLAYPPLGEWAQRELEGYPGNAELPDYRARRSSQVEGRFEAGLGTGFVNPIPSANVEEEHRKDLFSFELRGGVAQYEQLAAEDSLRVPWDQNFVSYYRGSFYPDFALESAWRTVSPGQLTQVLDSVRTRLLNFVLEIEGENPDAGEAEPGEAPIESARVTQIFNQTFHGDNTAFAAAGANVNQTQQTTVDLDVVRETADAFGISVEDRESLMKAVEQDGNLAGDNTRKWFGRLESGGIAVGNDTKIRAADAALMGVLGLS
jgi:AbiTii-like protein